MDAVFFAVVSVFFLKFLFGRISELDLVFFVVLLPGTFMETLLVCMKHQRLQKVLSIVNGFFFSGLSCFSKIRHSVTHIS